MTLQSYGLLLTNECGKSKSSNVQELMHIFILMPIRKTSI